LAFYFTNESFRQAAESTQGIARDGSGDEPITRPGTMTSFERIIRLELSSNEIKAASNNPIAAAEKIDLDRVRSLFQPPGVVRIVIFDDKRIPLFIIRHENMFPKQSDAPDTLDDYLKRDVNRDRARNFSWSGRRATIKDGRRLLEIRKVTDLFVTEHGRDDEPVLGWITDENLRKPM
jgi:hypothetical protein